MSASLVEALRSLSLGRSLTAGQAEQAFLEILAGQATEPRIASFLTALRIKGETADELAGAVAAVRSRMIEFEPAIDRSTLVDTCGTGGDLANTLNISTAAAIVVAACGERVAKHGNRSASGNSGSAEVLAELGVAVEADADVLAHCLTEVGITFLFAPRFHPGMKFAAPVRRELPFRTLFNLVGPLANPARPGLQLVGVPAVREAELVAKALTKLGTTRAAVVTGHGGLDEVALDGPTRVFLVDRGSVSELSWRPEEMGLGPVDVSALRVSGPKESAAWIVRILGGEPGPGREVVLANTAAALWVAGEENLRESVARAARAIDSGAASRLLKRWAEVSRPGAS
jgi:anthranilate phosphoribosyltransferase